MAGGSRLPSGFAGSAAAYIASRDSSQSEARAEQMLMRLGIHASKRGQGGKESSSGKWHRVPMTPAQTGPDPTVFEYYTGQPDRYRVNAINAIAGWQDTLTFGLAEDARKATGFNEDVDHDSTSYKVGEVAGVGTSLLYGGLEGIEAAGVKTRGLEFSHWIPNRMGGPRTIWNGNYVTPVEHAMSDPYRYRFMRKWWKDLKVDGKRVNAPPPRVVQQWVRIPKVYKGAAAGAGAGTVGAVYSKRDDHW